MIKVQSSTIDHLHYEAGTKVLEVKFKNGGTYHYHDVPFEAYENLRDADSVGSHFHKYFRNQYRTEKKA